MTKILFLDLDGTVRQTKSGATFINDPHDQQIIEGVVEAIARYPNYLLIGITNQGGVAAGKKSLEDAIEEQKYTMQLIPKLLAVYFCPDFEGENCYRIYCDKVEHYRRSHLPNPNFPTELLYSSFRKPGSGMLMLAIDKFKHIPDECLFVGDRTEDELAARAANIPFIWAEDWRNS
jgi:D-glycero-D-manno-heptose 1,7-bisphosphate phosphatase